MIVVVREKDTEGAERLDGIRKVDNVDDEIVLEEEFDEHKFSQENYYLDIVLEE